MGPASPPRAGRGVACGGSSQAHRGSQVRRPGPQPADGMLSFHTAPVRGRAAALFPTLVAIKKCKFTILLLLVLLPTCKMILGHNGPTERPPESVGASGAGKHPPPRVGAHSTSSSNGLKAKEGQGSTQCPREQGRLLAAVSPSGQCCPSPVSLQEALPQGK